MALSTECQTPGAQYETRVQRYSVSTLVRMPVSFPELTEHEAEQLEANIHNALELALAPYFARTDERLLDQMDWYRRCLEDVQDGHVVRGLTEAKLGYDSALRELKGEQ